MAREGFDWLGRNGQWPFALSLSNDLNEETQ